MSDVEEKLKNSPELLGTKFIMINPEKINEPSPTIPKGFPQALIPKDLCQIQMAKLVQALIDNKYNNVKCEQQQSDYYVCKQRRDSLIFKRIKEWEIQTIDEISDLERKIYISSLEENKIFYLNIYEKIAVIPKNKAFRGRVANDIKQLDWRLNYINNAIKSVFDV